MGRILYDVLEINIAVTIVILLLCLLAEKLRKTYGARWLRLAWALLAVRLVLPYNFSLPSTEIRLFDMPGFAQEAQAVVENTSEEKLIADAGASIAMGQEGSSSNPAMNDMTERVEREDTVITSGEDAVYNAPIEATGNITTDTIESTTANNIPGNISVDPTESNVDENVSAQIPMEKEQTSVNHREGMTYTNILLYVWLAGVIGFALYYIIIYVTFQKKCQKGMQPLENGELLEQIDALQIECLGKVKLQVYQSDMASSPMLAGMMKPKLVLPAKDRIWQVQELRMVVLHELCHYRRKDLWLKLLVLTAQCLNWFNPALYLMKKECFYDIELACDMVVLEGCNAEERAMYATTMLYFAQKEKQNTMFSTGFAVGKRKLKNRISNMFDGEKKKKGFGAFTFVVVLLLGMSLLISCGYKPMEQEGENEQQVADKKEISSQTSEQRTDDTVTDEEASDHILKVNSDFSYNNAYNNLLRVYNDNTYLSRPDGIYQIQEDDDICLFENQYNRSRGMAVYKDKLYFCGSTTRRNEKMSTIYYMDLNTYEVKDALGWVSNSFYTLYDVTIYEDNMYVSTDPATKIGFQLDEKGYATERLDATQEEFLYKEQNAYYSLQKVQWDTQFGTEQWQAIGEQMKQMYCPTIDVAAGMELLGGKQVVSKYKDEISVSFWMTDGNGNYEYLCDAFYSDTPLITKQGIYYKDYIKDGFFYTDFATKETRDVFTKGSVEQIYLLNYDATYVYFAYYAYDEAGEEQPYLMRMPHEGGEAQVIYEFEEGFRIDLLPEHNSIDAEYMYIDKEYYHWTDEERIALLPQKAEPISEMDNIGEKKKTEGNGILGMQQMSQEEVAVLSAIVEYTLDEAMTIGEVLEFEGELPGTGIGTLYTITIDGVEHFYCKYDFYGTERKDYCGYAIFSEDYVLANGIKVGMSQAEILEMYPNMRIEDFEGNCISDSEYKDATWWNGTAYPTSTHGTDPDFEYNGKDYVWLDQFDYVMIADIDLGTYDTLPICLGLLMKDEMVKAITFYYPTAG